MLYGSLFYVLVPLCLAASITLYGVLDRAKVELGFEHYTEKADPNSMLKMPANALVNFGYLILGIYWILVTKKTQQKLKEEAFFYYVFSWLAVFYSAVQFGRIVTQTRVFAILDQWLTLPFFAWVVCWNEYVYRDYLWQSSRFMFIMRLSILSYAAALFHDQGFEFSLGLHILAAVAYSVRTQTRIGNKTSLKYFVYACVSCSGFVFLKLADHYLGQFDIFQRFSGHFWSKIADIGQIYCVLKYFQSL
ncbi:predicted protein, partial [Nematostella vectensis]